MSQTLPVSILTLIADVATVAARARAAPARFELRPSTVDDLGQVGRLYFRSYDPGVACGTEDEALADVSASFNGDYGEYLPEASPVVLDGFTIVAAVMTVEQAPWVNTPTCPFVIDLFVAPKCRRVGLASALLGAVAKSVSSRGESIALRVDEYNVAALALYDSIGFRRW